MTRWILLLLSLTLLVMTHELGHLLVAKLFRTRVRRFYIFFNWGFSIFKARKFNGKWHFLFFNREEPNSWKDENLLPSDQNNTLWGLGWVPLGGYCDIAGMIDESKSSGDLPSEPQPWEYRSKPAWQRLCIVSAGVVVNFVSALLIFSMIFCHWGKDELPLRNATLGYNYIEPMHEEGFADGDIIYAIDGRQQYDYADAGMSLLLDNPSTVTVMRDGALVDLNMSGRLLEKVNRKRADRLMSPRMPFVVKSLAAGSPAERAGMMPGDSVVSVGGKPMAAYSDIAPALAAAADSDIVIGFYRQGRLDSVMLHLPQTGKLGVMLETDIARLFTVEHTSYSFFQALPAGIKFGWKTLVEYVSSLRAVFAPGGLQALGGFGTMSSIFPNHFDWQSFWSITAMLALILAFMNIIPIPGLDGGHIVFTLWEIVTGKKPGDRFLDVAQSIGMLLLLALMVLANGNDLWRWLSGKF
ncbi:MAG: RIP metalloprotease RseP [Bacteroidales bacterium]|nr:RIP metalloprotease RseP [Bacteroidales bacterium]